MSRGHEILLTLASANALELKNMITMIFTVLEECFPNAITVIHC
jgi:hypothetical protein